MSDWIQSTDKPEDVFKSWFEQAQKVTDFEPTAMTLATVDSEGMPSARVVLLKKYDESGLCFFTNFDSKKGEELKTHPKAALAFHWEKPFHRQIRVRGVIEQMSYAESNEYFQTRPRGSQIGAWASPQSHVIENREELEKRVAQFEAQFEGKEIPCPDNWGGYRLKVLSFEFWEAYEFRLHDRIKFVRSSFDSPWSSERLAP
mgnify:CR=1 FL=1